MLRSTLSPVYVMSREWSNISPLGQMLQTWMRQEGYSLKATAERCQISAAGLKKNMLLGHQAEHKTLQKIAQGIGIPIEQIEALARGQAVLSMSQEDTSADMVMIPRYALEASAGRGAFTDEEQVEDILALSLDFVRGVLHTQPDHLSALYVRGDSMEPLLRAGDMAVIDHANRERTDGMYVLRINGTLLIKSLQWLPGGRLRVKSENLAYEAYTVDPGHEDISIIGRVVWAGRKF